MVTWLQLTSSSVPGQDEERGQSDVSALYLRNDTVVNYDFVRRNWHNYQAFNRPVSTFYSWGQIYESNLSYIGAEEFLAGKVSWARSVYSTGREARIAAMVGVSALGLGLPRREFHGFSVHIVWSIGNESHNNIAWLANWQFKRPWQEKPLLGSTSILRKLERITLSVWS